MAPTPLRFLDEPSYGHTRARAPTIRTGRIVTDGEFVWRHGGHGGGHAWCVLTHDARHDMWVVPQACGNQQLSVWGVV